jgi:hypothetical protein
MTGTGRWEWRTFARSLANIGPRPDAQGVVPLASREYYVLSVASVHNVKIRDNCLDIKTLVRTDDLGLEQWEPTFKAQFPIDETALDAAWTAWGFPHPIVEKTRCTLDQFLTEVVPTERGLRAVEIEKRRTPLVVLGCPGERAWVTVGDEVWESISFEHADQYRVWRAVRALGLENAENTNYPRALKRIVGFQFVEQPKKMEIV